MSRSSLAAHNRLSRTQNLAWLLAVLTFVHAMLLVGYGVFWPGAVATIIALFLFWAPRLSSFFDLTVGRAKFVLFLQLVMLASVARKMEWAWSEFIVVFDMMILTFVLQYIHTPDYVEQSFWQSVKNALRLAIPITGVILLVFEFYPEIGGGAGSPSFATSGFGVEGEMNPSLVEALNESDRRVFVVAFPKGGKLPRGENLYWRSQVLTQNEGLRWRQEKISFGAAAENITTNRHVYAPSRQLIEHEVRIFAKFSSFGIALDTPLYMKAKNGDADSPLTELWGHVFWGKVEGRKPRILKAESTEGSVTESPPSATERQILLRVGDNRLATLLPEPLRDTDAAEKLDRYFGSGRFQYSLTPGMIPLGGVWEFLQNRRRGFCEHYAASAANLLRAYGIPARVVLGYFGGEWSGWDNTLLVREKDAHAWVEFWSDQERRWIRYDAVSVLVPERVRLANQIFSRTSIWSWVGQTQQMILNSWNSMTDRLDDSTNAFQNLFPSFDVELFLTIVFLSPAVALFIFWVRKTLRERADVSRQLERLAAEFLRNALRLGLEVDSGRTFRDIARQAYAHSDDAGAAATAFVDDFEYVRYANGAYDGTLRKRLRRSLRCFVKWAKAGAS